MEVEDNFEEWDDSDQMDMKEIESIVGEERRNRCENGKHSDGEDSEDEDDDEENERLLRCKKCRKIYRSKTWFLKHKNGCDGAPKGDKSRRRMTENQLRTRKILSGLGVDDYFVTNGLPAVVKLLKNICDTPSDIVKIRGERYANLMLQAKKLREDIANDSTVATVFLKEVTQKLWEIIFALDERAKSSTRNRYIAQHFTLYKTSTPLLLHWTELLQTCGINSNGNLLLQKILSAVYEDINMFRSTSVITAMETVDRSQQSENRTELTSTEKSIVAYIAGYVCRKTRDKLQKYCTSNERSTTTNVQENCRLGNIVKIFSDNSPDIKKQTPSLTYPNLITVSVNRGGLTTVDPATFDFFCSLEKCVRPFLNIASFRSSTRESDSELLEQLVENTPVLQESWPYSSFLNSEDSLLLLKLCFDLFYRVRKWAYLKVYKEHKKLTATLSKVNKQNSSYLAPVDLHGKDSIRKALLCSINSQK